MVAGILISQFSIALILLIDLLTFGVAVGTLLLSQIPQPAPLSKNDLNPPISFWQDTLTGLRFIRQQRGLFNLVWFTALVNFLWGIVAALLAPLILGFGTPNQLGLILSIAGTGLLSGSLLMSAWGGSTPKIKGVFFFEGLSAVGFLLIATRPWAWLIAIGVFCAHFSIAIVQGSIQSIWQTQVPAAAQGRVFAAQQMLTRSFTPLALLIAGPLAEKIIQPMLIGTPSLSHVTQAWSGTGIGQGIAFIFLSMAIIKFGLVGFSMLNRNIRLVEKTEALPDSFSQ
jgi:hypothetical protein